MAQFKKTLYKPTKGGNVATYRIEIKHYRNKSEVLRYHASVLGGKEQCDITTVDSGVNIGKSNETTIEEQALRVANTTYNLYLDKGYKDFIPKKGADNSLTNAEGLLKPMLANKYEAKHQKGGKKDLFAEYEFVFNQPKLNGTRCTAVIQPRNNSFVLLTRNCKVWTETPHINAALKELTKHFDFIHDGKTIILDGELYIHGKHLQDISSALKKNNADSSSVMFNVYDVAISGLDQEERFGLLDKLFAACHKAIKTLKLPITRVTTITAHSHVQIKNQCEDFERNGYEGGMLRLPDGVYEFGHRSNALLKVKKMVDEEFEIVGAKEAKGRDKGTAVFIVKNHRESTKPTFDVRPEGSYDLRAAYWKNIKKLKGKMLTVQYQELSKDNVPIFPVGVVIRDYE